MLLWFNTAESLIHTVVKVLDEDALRANRPPLAETARIVDKLTGVQKRLGVDLDDPDVKRFNNRFRDFATVRNRLSHDLTAVKNAELHHSAFIGEVGNANEIDLLEACAISVSVCAHLRAPFAGADLMPSVSLNDRFFKADSIAVAVIFRAFFQILSLKGLTTDFRPEVQRLPLNHQSLVPFQALVSHQGPAAPKSGATAPDHVDAWVDALLGSQPRLTEEKFELPNYVRPD